VFLPSFLPELFLACFEPVDCIAVLLSSHVRVAGREAKENTI